MKQKQKKHGLHLKRVSLFFVLVLAFFIVKLDASAISPTTSNARVLAYATNMSRDGLLGSTNAARIANGLSPLAINTKLNNAAQAKAQHMADNNYWAHTAPDGTQPWYFFNQAGYSYLRAGENLAYGFSDSQTAVDGWMNSPSHRDNILGNYVDVGFGIVNVPNYQDNGEQTIVVAHYGTLVATAPVTQASPAPATPGTPSTPVPTPSDTSKAPASAPQQPVSSQPEAQTPSSETEAPQLPEPSAIPATVTANPEPVATAETSRISVLSMLSARQAPFAVLSSLLLVAFAAAGYVLTHRAAFRQTVHAGEHFVVAHPGVDAAIIAAFAALILLTTYGNIG